MTMEHKRQVICEKMGFKDPDFLKWQDGMWEAEEFLIARQKEAGDDIHHPYHKVWARYVNIIRLATDRGSGGDIHASVDQRQDAFLKAVGVMV